MINKLQKSFLRPEHEPRVVDADSGCRKIRNNGRRHKNTDDRDKQRSRRNENHRSAKNDDTYLCKVPHTFTNTLVVQQPYFVLDMVVQPAKTIQIGMPVGASVMISLAQSSLEQAICPEKLDTSLLFAIASLVTDQRNGENLPLEAGSLTGQKLFDSVHPIPTKFSESGSKDQSCRFILGYVSFNGLLIRQPGTYRLRITLVEMGEAFGAGATSILAVDSEPIRVERRGAGFQRPNSHFR